MTHTPQADPASAHPLWTIARIQNVLTNETLIRHFLLDLTHAPEQRVMDVFTAWRNVAATIEANSAQQHSPNIAPTQTTPRRPLSSAPE